MCRSSCTTVETFTPHGKCPAFLRWKTAFTHTDSLIHTLTHTDSLIHTLTHTDSLIHTLTHTMLPTLFALIIRQSRCEYNPFIHISFPKHIKVLVCLPEINNLIITYT